MATAVAINPTVDRGAATPGPANRVAAYYGLSESVTRMMMPPAIRAAMRIHNSGCPLRSSDDATGLPSRSTAIPAAALSVGATTESPGRTAALAVEPRTKATMPIEAIVARIRRISLFPFTGSQLQHARGEGERQPK